MKNFFFPWSDNWWIEQDKAWFCSGVISALFCIDMNKSQCELVARLPECDILNFRLYSYCAKFNDMIYCLPEEGKCIWCYDIQKKSWKKIGMQDIGSTLIYLDGYKTQNDRIWLMGYSSRRILEMNMRKALIEKEYVLPRYENQYLGQYVLVDNILYCVNGKKINCIDLDCADITTYELEDVKAELYTICYDGTDFWLSSYCKEIYIWNPEIGVIKVINKFPSILGLCICERDSLFTVDYKSFVSKVNPFFSYSISLGKYIWFIPYAASEIVYIDKISYEVYVLKIDEGNGIRGVFDIPYARLGKYLVEYIYENRYIGLYSSKNRVILEIDTYKLEGRIREYKLTENSIFFIAEEYYKEIGIFNEKIGTADSDYYRNKFFYKQYIGKINKKFFEVLVQNKQNRSQKVINKKIGALIYRGLCE